MLMVRLTGILVLGILLAALSGCGSDDFAPNPGPFAGSLRVAGSEIGDFSFTAGNGQVAGTCTLTHNEQQTIVAISGNINGSTISGQLQNVNLGSGTFVGNFSSANAAAGTFTYTDAGGISTQSGTWTAVVSPPD